MTLKSALEIIPGMGQATETDIENRLFIFGRLNNIISKATNCGKPKVLVIYNTIIRQ